MKVITSVKAMARLKDRAKGEKIALVPTMGALHAGHLALVAAAQKNADLVVVSIFVNPIQFGPNEDFTRYPRDLSADRKILKKFDPVVIFAPTAEAMYPADFNSFVEVKGLDENLCGKSRPDHFRGVATVVARLFNIVKPDLAFFGEKDYQQQAIVKKMVRDLNFGVRIVTVPTVREKDGLALSSRNRYLSPGERNSALLLYRSLKRAQALIAGGEKNPKTVVAEAEKMLNSDRTVALEYFSIVDPESLAGVGTIAGKVVVAVAARIGRTRLIDNLSVHQIK